MDKLGVFDQFFYKAEQYQVASMVMGGASILEPAKPGEKLDPVAIADHLAARLQNIPLLRKKFVQDPLRIGTMRRIDNPDFDIRDHIFLDSIPRPGGYRELTRCLAEHSARPLAAGRLWRWTVVEGLAQGRLAVICKLHHAVADGVGAMEVLSSMYDANPVAPEKPSAISSHGADASSEPSPYTLLGDAIAESTSRLWVKTPRFLVKNTRPLLSALGSGARKLLTDSNTPDQGPLLPELQSTSLNTGTGTGSGQRAISYKTMSLPEIKMLARHFSCTVNDIGLLLYSYAMQHYFDRIGEQVDFDLCCGVPMSTRSERSSEGGNQVTVARINLHNTIADASKRLKAISLDSAQAKQFMRPETPPVDIDEVAELIFPAVLDGLLYLTGKLNLLGRVASKVIYVNALMSNVPGPPGRVYIANAAMVDSIPMIPVIDLVAVSGGFVSVDQVITIGFHCQGEAVEDPELFVKGVELGLEALRKARGKKTTPRKHRATRRPARRKPATLASTDKG